MCSARARRTCRRRSGTKPRARCSTRWAWRSAARRHETVDIAVAALAPFSGPAQATVFGRSERLDILHAALINGITSHVLRLRRHAPADRDPSGRPGGLGHPGARRDSAGAGRRFPERPGARRRGRVPHRQRGLSRRITTCGWHITGTAGVFGAAAAAGKLLGLNEQQMVWALGLAATQPVGLREMFGAHDQEVPSRPRRAERPDRGAAGGEEFHQLRRRAWRPSAAGANVLSD